MGCKASNEFGGEGNRMVVRGVADPVVVARIGG